MAYDPRTDTGIPTEPVGSLPRPAKLQAAYADYDAGKITREQLEAEQDEAVKDSITRGEATGAPIISDGEQRRSSFATYAITDTLAGTGLADHLAGEGGQFFAIFADGHSRQLPRLTGWRRGPIRATRGRAPACCPTSSSSTTACSRASPPRSASTSACIRARAATATRCTARTSPTATCSRACSR